MASFTLAAFSHAAELPFFFTHSKPTKSPGSTQRGNKPLLIQDKSTMLFYSDESVWLQQVLSNEYLFIGKRKRKYIHQAKSKIPWKTHAVFLILSQHFQTDPSISSLASFCSIVLEEIGTRWWKNLYSQIGAVMCTVKQKDGEFASRGRLHCWIGCWAPTKLWNWVLFHTAGRTEHPTFQYLCQQ